MLLINDEAGLVSKIYERNAWVYHCVIDLDPGDAIVVYSDGILDDVAIMALRRTASG